MTRANYVEASENALSLFEYGQVIMMSKLCSIWEIKHTMKCLLIVASNIALVKYNIFCLLH